MIIRKILLGDVICLIFKSDNSRGTVGKNVSLENNTKLFIKNNIEGKKCHYNVRTSKVTPR